MSSPDQPAPLPLSGPGRTIAATVAASTLAALPSLLLGGLAVLVSAELNFGAFELGVAIAIFFAVSGLLSVPAALLSEGIGPRRALFIGGFITAIALVGTGAFTGSWLALLPWMAVGGLGNTLTQISSNHLLAQQVRSGRQGLAFGIKQSAIPIAGMLAGLGLPVFGLTLGWRATYLIAAVGLIPVLALLHGLRQNVAHRGRVPRAGDAPIAALALLSTGAGLGAAAGSALTAFTVIAAVQSGFAASAAGLLLTAGSVVGVSARVLSGGVADRMGRGSLLLASGLVGGGVLGYVGLAIGGPSWLVVVATLVAFGGGWGWPGLVLLATARTNPRSPATAMAVTRLGPSVGNIIGPLVFGAVAGGIGYSSAWLIAAVAALISSVLMLAARPLLSPYRQTAQRGET